MRIDHDFHIHTNLSSCADETATLENYLDNARQYGLKKLGFTDHLWDSAIDGARRWYQPQNFEHVVQLRKQLEQAANSYRDVRLGRSETKPNEEKTDIQLYFGCEAEYDFAHRGIALSEEVAEQFDFILVPNSHTHLTMPKSFYGSYQEHADYMVQAYEDILSSPVSCYVTAVAHPFQAVNCPYGYGVMIDLISDNQFERLFDRTAEKGIAFEINMADLSHGSNEEIARTPQMRMFRLAKKCGCKFIFGSDAHSKQPHGLYHRASFVADILELNKHDLIDLVR